MDWELYVDELKAEGEVVGAVLEAVVAVAVGGAVVGDL